MTRDQLNERLRFAGLKKKDLGILIGQSDSHVSTLGVKNPVRPHVLAIIRAWELMAPDQRMILMHECADRAYRIRDAKDAAE